MNFTGIKARLRNALRPGPTKTLLPISASITLPAGLDWVVKQRLTAVILATLRNYPVTSCRIDDLCRLDLLLSKRSDIYQVKLYGYEVSVLLSFLLEQQRSYGSWAPSLVSAPAIVTIQAQLRGILPLLRMQVRQLDCHADRPIHVH